MAKFYIADTHFKHKNILRFDNRPWPDLVSMERDMIDLWNARVHNDDEVYIIGDFCFGSVNDWQLLLSNLNGLKHLVIGNHDLKQYPPSVRKYLASDPVFYKEITDEGHRIILSHYPMLSYKHDTNPDVYMFYGHVHNTIEATAIKSSVSAMATSCRAKGLEYQGNLFNCWCGLFSYAPATFKDIIKNKGARTLC